MEKEPIKILVGVDPGLMTGISAVDITDLNDPQLLWTDEWTIEEFHGKIEDLMSAGNVSIVIEAYIITVETAKKSPQPWSLNLIGVVHFLAQKYGVEVTMQSPAQKQFATNDRLRQVGFWEKGTEGHSQDSLRHIMVRILSMNRRWASKLIIPDKEEDG